MSLLSWIPTSLMSVKFDLNLNFIFRRSIEYKSCITLKTGTLINKDPVHLSKDAECSFWPDDQ